MRFRLTVLLACCAVASLAAQLPIPRGLPVPRDLPLPSIDRWLGGGDLVSTSIADARVDVPWLDRLDARFASLAGRRRAGGDFALAPGHWTLDLQSFCLHPGTRGPQPTDGRGYLSGPLEGRQSAIIRHMLERYGPLTEVTQHEMQLLVWAVLARTKPSDLLPGDQALLARLLSATEIAELQTGALDVIPVPLRRDVYDRLPPAARQVAEAENRIRELLRQANRTYDEVERAAVLGGPLPSDARRVPRERWSIHPGGYLVRYLPTGYSQTRVQLAVPARYRLTRDRLGRIVAIDFGDGRRTETEYDDALPPFAPEGVGEVTGYAFKSITLVRPGRGGRPERLQLRGKGWTFVMTPARRVWRRGGVAEFGLRLAAWQPDWMERFESWKERYDTWHEEFQERMEWYQERWEHATDPPPSVEDTLRDLEDLEHYRDGIEAALTGDIGDRLDWLIDHQERMNAALERATIVLSGLPDRSDEGYRPPMDVAIPASRGSQRLGLSSRGF